MAVGNVEEHVGYHRWYQKVILHHSISSMLPSCAWHSSRSARLRNHVASRLAGSESALRSVQYRRSRALFVALSKRGSAQDKNSMKAHAIRSLIGLPR